jgi:hypothetical protein
MSFCGSKEDAKKYAKEADVQIDGLELSNTSPVRSGSNEAGGAPMIGPKAFTTERTRHGWKGNQGGTRRSFPSEGVTGK